MLIYNKNTFDDQDIHDVNENQTAYYFPGF